MSLKRRLDKVQNHLIKSHHDINAAIDSFHKDIYQYGFDLGRQLSEHGFKLEEIIQYSREKNPRINFIFNTPTKS